jgi:hypothetical protein
MKIFIKETIIFIVVLFFGLIIVNDFIFDIVETYDCQSYIDRYSDLRSAFGSDCGNRTTNKDAFDHFFKNGYKEGRDSNKVGDRGARGITGDKGDIGLVGSTGNRGLIGDKGDTGLIGNKGDTGMTGNTGLIGEKGDTGLKGIQGIQGIQGISGDKGIEGKEGELGEKGDRGEIGEPGLLSAKIQVVEKMIGGTHSQNIYTSANW